MNTFESEKWWIWISVGTSLRLLLGKFFSFLGKRGGVREIVLPFTIGNWNLEISRNWWEWGLQCKGERKIWLYFSSSFCVFVWERVCVFGVGTKGGMVSCEKRRLIRTRYFHKICYKNFMPLLLDKKSLWVSFKFESIKTTHLWFVVKM